MRLVYHRRLAQVALILAATLFVFTAYSFTGMLGLNWHPHNFSSNQKASVADINSVCAECLEVDVLDIGQGDAIYIKAPNGSSMLIDAGPAGGQVNKEINEAGKNIFDNNIDILLATHPDADHIGGFEEVLQHFSAGLFIDPGVKTDTATYKNLIAEIEAKKIQHIVARRGLDVVLDKDHNIIFHVLYPDDAFYAFEYDQCQAANAEHKLLHKPGGLKKCQKVFELETNEMSIVGKLIYGDTSFLLTGDAPENVEDFLVHEFSDAAVSCDAAKYSDPKSLCADVLKVGHHGSKYSTSEEFLAAVSPHYAAISVGAKNRYGHPAERVLEALAKASSTPEILRTDQMGAIRFISDGDTVTVEK